MGIITRRDFLRTTSAAAAMLGSHAITPCGSGRWAAQAAEPAARVPLTQRKSFCFLHSYEATGRYWRGLEKAGLLRLGNGVRLVNSPWGDDTRRFNAVARIGGPLESIIRQRKCNFIVDRVAGGCPWHVYAFDAQLIEHYAALLGEKFLGGQVHETVGNVRTDWDMIAKAQKLLADHPVPAEKLAAWRARQSVALEMEYGDLDSYAGRTAPKDPAAWWKEFERGFKTQSARFHGRCSYCEGSGCGEMSWHIFYKFGAAYCLAEMGTWASRQSQFAIASLRGAAKAAGKPWGVFFAPWGPKGVTCFIPDKDQSWQCGESPPNGEKGPSSALQRRIFFHAYLSGAYTLHEEWGGEGNLLDWDQGKISSYGKVTRDLLDFQEAHADVGQPYTPIALVLEASIPPADAPLLNYSGESPHVWTVLKKQIFAYADADRAAAARKGSGDRMEAECYAPCALPELFDVVPADAPGEVWGNYKEVIPVGEAPVPPGAKPCPPEAVYDRLAAAAEQYSPFRRSTHLPMQINRRSADGAWIVGLYNPWGAERGDVANVGSILDEGCTMHDTLRPMFSLKSARAIHAWPRNSGITQNGNDIQVAVGPGGTLILEVK